jgi:ribosomal protein L40E
MKSEKGISAKDALKNKLNQSDNNMKFTLTQPKTQLNPTQSRKELIEKSKLSRLPERTNRPKFEMPNFSFQHDVCVNCGGRLDPDDNIQQSVKVCRKCLTQYAVIDAAIDEASKRKRQAMLEKFAPEVKR